MIKWIIDKVKGIITFIKETILTTGKVIIEFIKETIINAPAVTIMTFATFGITNTMTNLNLQTYFVPIGFINEFMILSVLSVTVVLILSTIAGNIAEATE